MFNVVIGGASRKPNIRGKMIEIIWRPRKVGFAIT